MRRRDLLFGLLAVATLRSARAQQSRKVHRIAFVSPASPAAQRPPGPQEDLSVAHAYRPKVIGQLWTHDGWINEPHLAGQNAQAMQDNDIN